MKTNKRAVETILVAKTDGGTGQALLAGGSSIIDANGHINLADGQLAIVNASAEGSLGLGVALTAGDDIQDAPAIQIYQGTPYSAAPGEVYPGMPARTHEKSGLIIGENNVRVTGAPYAAPSASGFVVSAFGTPADDTSHQLQIAIRGRRADIRNSMSGREVVTVEYVTPNYTDLATAAPADHLIQNLVAKINLNSRIASGGRGSKPFVAFAVDASGSLANPTLTSLTTPGTATGYGFNTTAAMSQAIADIIANTALAGTSEVVPIDLTTAGATAIADNIIIIALDDLTSMNDDIAEVKVRLEVLPVEGFNASVTTTEGSYPFEGQGTYRQWNLFYNKTFNIRKYDANRHFWPFYVPDNYLVQGETYDAYVIEHYGADQIDLNTISVSPQKAIILVPNSDTTTKTAIEAILNPWIASTPAKHKAVTI